MEATGHYKLLTAEELSWGWVMNLSFQDSTYITYNVMIIVHPCFDVVSRDANLTDMYDKPVGSGFIIKDPTRHYSNSYLF